MNTIYKVENNVVVNISKTSNTVNRPLEDGEFLGEPPCKIGCDITTGEPPLPTEEQLIQEEIAQLNETIAKKKLRDMDYTEELARLNELDPI